jgi:hypothetical protein
MSTMITTFLIIAATLAALAYLTDKRSSEADKPPPVYSLLPGDIKYESPSGNVRVYFPITTSIVLSIVLTLLLRFFG